MNKTAGRILFMAIACMHIAQTVVAAPFRACAVGADYNTLPPSLTHSIDPIPLLGTASSVCAAAGPNSPCAPHLVYEPHPAVTPRAPLVVFLPGTNMEPDKHDQVLSMAAYAGYRTIGLSYDNRTSMGTLCPDFATDPVTNLCGNDCRGQGRTEVIEGGGLTPLVVEDGDTIVDRLYKVLEELENIDPFGGWGGYIAGSGIANPQMSDIDWSQIIIAGFSQGGGHAAKIAHDQQVMGQVLIEGGTDTCFDAAGVEQTAEWILATPSQSSSQPMFGLFNRRGAAASIPTPQSWRDLGFPRRTHDFDATVPLGYDVLDTRPPVPAAQTDQAPVAGCNRHSGMAKDDCMPTDVTGSVAAATPDESRLFEPYLQRFCYACDGATCP